MRALIVDLAGCNSIKDVENSINLALSTLDKYFVNDLKFLDEKEVCIITYTVSTRRA